MCSVWATSPGIHMTVRSGSIKVSGLVGAGAFGFGASAVLPSCVFLRRARRRWAIHLPDAGICPAPAGASFGAVSAGVSIGTAAAGASGMGVASAGALGASAGSPPFVIGSNGGNSAIRSAV